MKREPLLADHLLSMHARRDKDLIAPRWHETLCSHLREAKRFVLDEQAALYVAEMLVRAPRIVADAQDFAIPPFKKMWVELPYRGFYQTITKGISVTHDPSGDTRIGYLVVGANAYPAAQGPSGEANFVPFIVRMNQPYTLAEELEFCEKVSVSRATLDMIYWGSAYQQLSEEQDQEGIRALRARHSLEAYGPQHMTAKAAHWFAHNSSSLVWQHLMESGAGDVRNIIALLLFLNRTSKIQTIQEIGMAPKVLHRRPVMLLKHSVVSLKLDPAPMLLKLCAGEGIWRRLHDVRGHFCHNKAARENDHDHEWQDISDRPSPYILQWRCSCGGLRWWRREHRRGHEEKGMVASEYSVIK